jgi:hypothetical protein
MGAEGLSPHPSFSMSHATEKVQATPTSGSSYLEIPAGQSGPHSGTAPVSPHDDDVLFLLNLCLRIQAAYSDNTWFNTWEGQPSAPTKGGLGGSGARVIDLTEEYPITQRLADTALCSPGSSEYSLSDFIEIDSQAPHVPIHHAPRHSECHAPALSHHSADLSNRPTQ